MDRFFDPDSEVMVFLSGVADLIIANVLWVLTSLPIITLGASTTALYTVVKKPGEKQYSASVFKNFFHGFTSNFKKATLSFLILLVPTALVVVNLAILLLGLLENSVVGYFICGLSIFLLAFAWNYVFPLVATFENTALKTVVNSFLLAVANLPTTIALTVLNLIPLLMLLFCTELFFKGLMIWLFVGFALIAKLDSILLERVFRKYIPAPEAATE